VQSFLTQKKMDKTERLAKIDKRIAKATERGNTKMVEMLKARKEKIEKK